jgi:hypothetical protein
VSRRRQRFILLSLAGLSPLLVLGGAWWLVNRFVLAPRAPGPDATPDEVIQFVANEKGLPRLGPTNGKALLDRLATHMAADAPFRERLVAALRRESLDVQQAFRSNVFQTIKPALLSDIRRYHEIPGEQRGEFLDQRVVEYQRLAGAFRSSGAGGSLRDLLPDREELLRMLIANTTDEERDLGSAYVTAYLARVQQIRADPQLQEQFNQRVAAGPP